MSTYLQVGIGLIVDVLRVRMWGNRWRRQSVSGGFLVCGPWAVHTIKGSGLLCYVNVDRVGPGSILIIFHSWAAVGHAGVLVRVWEEQPHFFITTVALPLSACAMKRPLPWGPWWLFVVLGDGWAVVALIWLWGSLFLFLLVGQGRNLIALDLLQSWQRSLVQGSSSVLGQSSGLCLRFLSLTATGGRSTGSLPTYRWVVPVFPL